MYKKDYHVGIGLTGLLLSIPVPTLIHGYFNNIITNDSINLLQMDFQGFEAQILLILMIATGISLFAITAYSLGGYLIHNLRFVNES